MLKCLVCSHVDNIKDVVIMIERRVENIIILSTENVISCEESSDP
jgi:hypothetical protein